MWPAPSVAGGIADLTNASSCTQGRIVDAQPDGSTTGGRAASISVRRGSSQDDVEVDVALRISGDVNGDGLKDLAFIQNLINSSVRIRY